MALKPKPKPKGIPIKGVKLKNGKLERTTSGRKTSVSAKIAARKSKKVRVKRRTA